MKKGNTIIQRVPLWRKSVIIAVTPFLRNLLASILDNATS